MSDPTTDEQRITAVANWLMNYDEIYARHPETTNYMARAMLEVAGVLTGCQRAAPLPQIGPADKDREIERLKELVFFYAKHTGVSEDVVRRVWKL